MHGLGHDLRLAWRSLIKNPGFSASAILTLALGVGLNTAVFSIVNAVLFKPLPVAAPQELVHVYTELPLDLFTHGPMAYPDYVDVRDQVSGFEAVAAYAISRFAWRVGEESEIVSGEVVSGSYFSTLGLRPVAGRLLAPEDDRPGGEPVAVLSWSAWQRRFGGDPGVVGDTVQVNGQPLKVLGIAPSGFTGLTRGLASELWIPMQLTRTLTAVTNVNLGDENPQLHRLDDRNRMWLFVVGRKQADVDFEQLRSQVSDLGGRLAREYPDSNDRRVFLAVPAQSVRLLPGVDTVLHVASLVVMGIVALVLLIASANIANMLLARAVGRRKEMATRLSLGASRGALVRQLLVESLLVSLLGGAAGLGLALLCSALLPGIDLNLPLPTPALDLSLDLRVLFFTLAAATLTALLFGLTPALDALRTDLSSALHDTSRGSSDPRSRRWLRNGLVVGEIALCLLLLACAGLSLRSMMNAQNIDPGFDPEGVVVASLRPDLQGYSPERAEELYRVLLERLRSLPSVRAAATASHLPLTFDISMSSVTSGEHRDQPAEDWPVADSATISPDYFEVMGIPLLLGRDFTPADAADRPPVGIVNTALAERFWPNEGPLGQYLYTSEGEEPIEIVGVVRDSKVRTLGEPPRPFLWTPVAQSQQPSRTLLVDFESETQVSVVTVRETIRSFDRELAIRELGSLRQATSPALLLPRLGAALFGLFGLLGLLLASVGIYSVISYSASRRTHEIGIRMALGAGRHDVLGLVLREGLLLAGVGVLAGLLAALFATRVLSSILYGIGANDPLTLAAVAIFLVAVALFATWVPAQRAARMNPLRALHHE